MRPTLTLLAICLFFNLNMASDTTITFRAASYTEIFEMAREEHKQVFLYFHFDGCGACVKMEKTAFINDRTAAFYNKHFVSLEVNTRKGAGIEINDIYNVQMHPTFLYLDDQGNVLHKIVGVFDPHEFLVQAEYALDPNISLTALRERYEAGERDWEFLFEYCYRLKDAHELDASVINAYLDTQRSDELGSERNIRFIYEFAVHGFKVTTPFGSPAFQYMYDHRAEFGRYFEADQVDTRIVWILNNAVYKAIEELDEVKFKEALAVMAEFDNGHTYSYKEMDGRITGMITSTNLVLSAKMAYYEKAGNILEYNKVLQEYTSRIWDDPEALNNMAWNYYEQYEDTARLVKAKSWAQRSVELNSNYANNDTYAALLFKLGEYEAALLQAQVAISVAEKNNTDFRETTELIKQINAAMEQ